MRTFLLAVVLIVTLPLWIWFLPLMVIGTKVERNERDRARGEDV